MEIFTFSFRQTLKLGRDLSSLLKPGDILCLFGPLGAGKTVLAKGVALGLGVPAHKVNSPAFVLIREYKGKIPLYHMDLYRLNNYLDIFSIGYEEYLYAEGITVIEWAQRLGYLLPKNYLRVDFKIVDKNVRRLKFSAEGDNYTFVLNKLKKYENIRNRHHH